MVSMVRHAEEATAEPRSLCAACQRCTASRSLPVAVQGHVGEGCAQGARRQPRGFIAGAPVGAATACSWRLAGCGNFEEAREPIGTMASSTRNLLHLTHEGRGTPKRR